MLLMSSATAQLRRRGYCIAWRYALVLLCILACWPKIGESQTPASNSAGGVRGTSPPTAAPLPATALGGSVVADFDTLMMLIQQTIDPDSWLLAGGQNTITPYPAGVYVDPQGYLRRLKESEKLTFDLHKPAAEAPRHPWRQPSQLRTISLRQIEASLADSRNRGVQPTLDLLKLAGLTRIQYVKVLAAEEDVLLAGPAGESEHGFLLQDLATTASLINATTAPMGCSIEPTNEGLLAAQQLLGERGTLERLARNPKLVVEQLQAKVGAHSISVFGMSPQCSTAIALIDADEHMKRVGFGTAVTSPRIKSYFDFLDEQAVVPKQSMIRWWFAFSDLPVESSAAGNIFQLPEHCVQVLSEQQWVSHQTGRTPTGAQDEAADKFAREMTRFLPQLRQTHPSYARLCGVFEGGLALQLALESTGQGNWRAWFPNLCGLGRALANDEQVDAPKTVEGLTTWHRLKSGTIVAVVSGGVTMDVKQLAARSQWRQSKFLTASVVLDEAAVPSAAHGRWWWD